MTASTKKQLAARQRRSLAAIRVRLLAMSVQWEDLDQYCVNVLEELADKAQETADALGDDAWTEAQGVLG